MNRTLSALALSTLSYFTSCTSGIITKPVEELENKQISVSPYKKAELEYEQDTFAVKIFGNGHDIDTNIFVSLEKEVADKIISKGGEVIVSGVLFDNNHLSISTTAAEKSGKYKLEEIVRTPVKFSEIATTNINSLSDIAKNKDLFKTVLSQDNNYYHAYVDSATLKQLDGKKHKKIDIKASINNGVSTFELSRSSQIGFYNHEERIQNIQNSPSSEIKQLVAQTLISDFKPKFDISRNGR